MLILISIKIVFQFIPNNLKRITFTNSLLQENTSCYYYQVNRSGKVNIKKLFMWIYHNKKYYKKVQLLPMLKKCDKYN